MKVLSRVVFNDVSKSNRLNATHSGCSPFVNLFVFSISRKSVACEGNMALFFLDEFYWDPRENETKIKRVDRILLTHSQPCSQAPSHMH